MKTQTVRSNKKVLTYDLTELLGGATAAKIDINAGSGNLTLDGLTSNEQVLASGTLEYLEKQGMPTRSLTTISGQDILTLKASGSGQPWFRLPWSACNGATDWQIHLNPDVPSEITAHSDGGNMELDLSSLAVSCLSADTGGGNLDVTLPDKAVDLNVIAKTGAGNVTVDIGSATRGSSVINASSGAGSVIVRVPDGLAARIHPASGMGKVIVNPRFSKLDVNTYQSPDYETAADRVEITIKSGAGNVSVDAR
jgi:hypothetical protein